MDQILNISNALCIPSYDLSALLQGRSITLMSNIFLSKGKILSLCSSGATLEELSLEESYNPKLLPHLSTSPELGKVCAWAEIRFCRAYTEADVDVLQHLTPWTKSLLMKLIQKRSKVFISGVRVYQLAQTFTVETENLEQKIGKFIGIPPNIKVSKINPVLQDTIFDSRLHDLRSLNPPQVNILDDLKTDLYELLPTVPDAQILFQDVDSYLNGNQSSERYTYPSDLQWIQTLINVANSSDGHTFEKLVRKAMILLGFQNTVNTGLNPEMTGGAGGLDVCCNEPYWVIGECKATKHDKVPTDTPAQLVYLGLKDLEYEDYEQSIKIIFPAGDFTNAARKIAEKVKMNVIHPETLAKLVDLKVKYPGALDLFKLKEVLEQEPFGVSSDQKINQFIERINANISLRSKIVASVKFLQSKDPDQNGFDASQVHINYISSNPNCQIQEVRDILVELSSPLAGYLGRSSIDGTDRFYYLRDLPQPPQTP